MVKKGFIAFIVFITTGIAQPTLAQLSSDTAWHRGGNMGISLNQVSVSNWAAGGENTVGFNLLFNYFMNYKKQRHLWNNRIEMDYGLNNTKTDGKKKTNDKIYLSSIYGYELRKNLYLSGLLTFQSQFAKGYDYGTNPPTYISRFMSPGYLTIGGGLTWTPKSWFIATFTPTTWRGTFVSSTILSDQGQFGVTPGKHLLPEFGAQLQMEAQYEFLKNMTVFSRLTFFTNYLENPQNVDIAWDIQLNMTINKWFAATVTTNMIYDDDTKILQKDGSKGPRLQFKEALGVGFQVSF